MVGLGTAVTVFALGSSELESEWMELGNGSEVVVGGQHHQIAANTELRQQGIDGGDVDPALAALVTQACGFDVVGAIGDEEGEGAHGKKGRCFTALARGIVFISVTVEEEIVMPTYNCCNSCRLGKN